MEHLRYSCKKYNVLFDSFEILGLKNFIISDDSKMINKVLIGLEKIKLTSDERTLKETNFSRLPFENLTDKEEGKLIETSQDFFNFLIPLAMHRRVRNNIKLYLGEDSIQKKEIEYSGVFQLYFYLDQVRRVRCWNMKIV